MPIIHKEYDKLSGVQTTFAIEDGQLRVNKSQDLTPHFEMTRARRDDPEYTKTAIKANILPAVHLPDVVCHEIKKKHGFDVYTASALELRQFLRKHRDEYSYCFMTEARI